MLSLNSQGCVEWLLFDKLPLLNECVRRCAQLSCEPPLWGCPGEPLGTLWLCLRDNGYYQTFDLHYDRYDKREKLLAIDELIVQAPVGLLTRNKGR